MRFTLTLFVALTITATGTQAQRGSGPGARPNREAGPSLVYYEGVNSPSTLPGMSRVDLLFRIDLSFFIAVRNEAAPLSSEFLREGELQVELLDSTGRVAARKIERFSTPGESSQPPPSTSWYQGAMTFDIPPGSYRIVFRADDLASERTLTENHRQLRAADFRPVGAAVSDPFFVAAEENSRLLHPHNIGGGVHFGRSVALAVVIGHAGSRSPERVIWSVSRLSEGDGVPERIVSPTPLTPGLFGVLSRPSGNPPSYTFIPSDSGYALLTVHVDANSLRPGNYSADLTVGDLPATQFSFEVIWPDMPRSLRNVEYAIQSLRYVVGKDELDSLLSGNDETLRKNLQRFWSSRDKTPETAYNEVMTEYYRRVDFSAMTFGTLREPDGSRTDQGRIYILYGKPSRTERKLDPSGFIEIWKYEEARKQFVFLDESRKGEYVLTATRPL